MEGVENEVHYNPGFVNDTRKELPSTSCGEPASTGVTMIRFKIEEDRKSTLTSSTSLVGTNETAKKHRQSCILVAVVIVTCLVIFSIVVGVFTLKMKSSVQFKQVQNNATVDKASRVHPMGLANASVETSNGVLEPVKFETVPNFINFTRASAVRARSRFISSNSRQVDTGMCVEIPNTECLSILPYTETYFPNDNDITGPVPPNLDEILACHKDTYYLFCSKLYPQCITDPDPVMPCKQTCEAAKANCTSFNSIYEWPFICRDYPEGTTGEISCRTHDRVCYETHSLNVGEVYELTSPNYPDEYPENSSCLWQFISPSSTRIQVDVINVDIEDYFDELIIGFGDNPYVLESRMLTINVSDVNETIDSPYNKVWIKFVTDHSIEYSGFKIRIKVLEVPDCLLDMYTAIDQNGTLSSSNCSSIHYDCVYLFSTPINTRTKLTFLYFRNTYAGKEGFRFGVGHNPFVLESEIFTTPTTDAVFDLDSNEGWIWFRADDTYSSGGFAVHISQIADYVSVEVDENQIYRLDSREEGFLNNPFYKNAVFTWKFVTSPRLQFKINFPDGLESLIYNSIEIGIGREPTRESTMLFRYDGLQVTGHNRIITVADNAMWIKYKGAIFNKYRHIHAIVSAVPKHSAILNVHNIPDPNTAYNVSHSGQATYNIDWIWIIGSECLGGSISVECISFDTHMPRNSYILIGQGQDPFDSSTVETVLCASSPPDKCPNDFIVSHLHVWVKYVGNTLNSDEESAEFRLAVRCIPREDALDQICSTKASVLPEDVCNNKFDCPDLTDELGCVETGICGSRPLLRPVARIVGGSYAGQGSWPWMGSLQRTTGEHICGCTLIDENWAITAAHCTTIHYDNELQILFGSTSLENLSQFHLVVKVAMIFPHPRYIDATEGYDITLLKLARSVPFTDYIRPACLSLNRTQFQSGHRCFVSGWGDDRRVITDELSVRLQEAAVPVMTNAECNDLQGSVFNITDTMICAGYPGGDIDSCQGDSGGPLVCPSNDGKWYLVGITSFGVGCGLPSRPGVYTRISTFKDYIDTITEIVTGNMYFQCASGFCLPKEYVCDGEHDCYNGEDEEQCLSVDTDEIETFEEASSIDINDICTSNQFDCGEKCIHINYQCDGIEDCESGADELHCSCNNWEIMCSDGMCIGYWQECDGVSDCNDGADEYNCIDDCTVNPTDFYRCPNGQCFSRLRICDGHNDCGDNSDETDCSILDLSNLRFVDSNTSYSRVEIYGHDSWYYIDINNYKIANVVCRQKGFSGASHLGYYSPHYSAIGLFFFCQGDEESLADCWPALPVNKSITTVLCLNECSEEETPCPEKTSPYKCIPKTAICDGRTDCYGVDDVPQGTDENHCFRMQDDNDGIVTVYKNESWSKICVQQNLWKPVYEKNICYQLHKGSPLISEFVHDNGTAGPYAALRTDQGEVYSNADYRNVAVQGLLHQRTTCESGLVLRLVCTEQVFENEIQDCGVSIESARIVGGDDAYLGRWPWQVSLQYHGQLHFCGGSLINHQWVVTAYHCFIGISFEQIEVWLGSINAINPDSQTLVRRNISKVVSHPKFGYINDDYALIKLSEPVIFTDAIKPVCLPTSNVIFEPGSYGYTTGWGSVIMYGNFPDVLQEVRVVVISLEYCRRHVHFVNVTDDMICLKDRNGGQGACHGDSGGPFVVNRDGRWYLVGVVTGARTCAGRSDPTIYARVSRFLDFTYYTIWEDALAEIPVA